MFLRLFASELVSIQCPKDQTTNLNMMRKKDSKQYSGSHCIQQALHACIKVCSVVWEDPIDFEGEYTCHSVVGIVRPEMCTIGIKQAEMQSHQKVKKGSNMWIVISGCPQSSVMPAVYLRV